QARHADNQRSTMTNLALILAAWTERTTPSGGAWTCDSSVPLVARETVRGERTVEPVQPVTDLHRRHPQRPDTAHPPRSWSAQLATKVAGIAQAFEGHVRGASVERLVERTAADQGRVEILETLGARLQRAQECLGYVEYRLPEAGAQVRILPGAPP